MELKSVQIGLKTPVIELQGTWEPSVEEARAAWELYVELVTRVGVVPIADDAGGDKEILASMYSLFGIHREVLKRYGPTLAAPKNEGHFNLGYLSVVALNLVVRPFLSKWHPRYDLWRSRNLGGEDGWDERDSFRHELLSVQRDLRTYAGWLAMACGVPDLTHSALLQP